MYTVKKYDNRKLYLPSLKEGNTKVKGRYISSRELLQLRKENGVIVLDNKTKQDITQDTVLSAINELAKEDSNVRDAVIDNFDKLSTFMLTPKINPEPVVKSTPQSTPPLNVSERFIKEEQTPSKNTIVAKEEIPSDREFTGF